MQITAKAVADLRARTGVGLMDCKRALAEADGDQEKAINVLREKGFAAAAKKAGRIAAEGVAYATVCAACKKGVIVEINCETDFAAKSDKFMDLVKTISGIILKKSPANVEELLKLEHEGRTVEDYLKEKIYTIGENISVRRFEVIEGNLTAYVHGGGRISVIVKLDAAPEIAATEKFAEASKDIAMHVAAMNPAFLNEESVDEATLEKEKEIAKAAALNEGKPAAVVDKIVQGRIKKFYKEACLVEQPFVKDAEISVEQYLRNVSKEVGGEITPAAFIRYERGEGLAKREDDFAEEVANMVKK